MPYSILQLEELIQKGHQDEVMKLIRGGQLNLNFTLYLGVKSAIANKSNGNMHGLNADMIIVNELLCAGANPYSKGCCPAHASPLMVFASSDLLEMNDPSVVCIGNQFLRNRNHYNNSEEAFLCLKQACTQGRSATAELIMLCHPEVMDAQRMQKFYYCKKDYKAYNFRNERFFTPLDIAVSSDFASTAQLLLAYGADLSSIYSKNVLHVNRESGLEPGESHCTPVYALGPAATLTSPATLAAVESVATQCSPSLNLLLRDRVQNFLIPCAMSLAEPQSSPPAEASRRIIEYFASNNSTQKSRNVFCHLINVINAVSTCYTPSCLNSNLSEVWDNVTRGFSAGGIHNDINILGDSMMKLVARQRQLAKINRPRNACEKLSPCAIL